LEITLDEMKVIIEDLKSLELKRGQLVSKNLDFLEAAAIRAQQAVQQLVASSKMK
jgi:hypothetical protein